MLRRCAALGVSVVAAAASTSACGGSSSTPAAAPAAPAPATSTPAPCRTPANAKPTTWPAKVPADLPKPPNAHIQDATKTPDGVYLVKFTTPTSLRESVLFVVQKLPQAGYVLGRGDAEATEADAPFVHGNIRGLMRMIGLDTCRTQWLLATVDTSAPVGSSPLLTPHTPSTSPSPLPFG